MMEMGQARRGLVDETCCEWMTFTMRKGATRPKHEPLGLGPRGCACEGQRCATLTKLRKCACDEVFCLHSSRRVRDIR